MSEGALLVFLLLQAVLFAPWLIYLSRAWNGRADAAERVANAVLHERRAFRELEDVVKHLKPWNAEALGKYRSAVSETERAKEELEEAVETWEALYG